MSTLVYSKIFNEGWQNVFDIVKTISDPLNRGSKFVYTTFPKVEDITHDDYPMVCVSPLNIVRTEDISLKDLRDAFLSIEIIILTTKPEDMDSISDEIIKKMEETESTLFGYYMKNMGILRSNATNVERGGLRIHRRSVVFGFQFDYT